MFETVVISAIFFVLLGLFLTFFILLTKHKLVSDAPISILINDEVKTEVPGGGTLLTALSTKDYKIPSPCGGKATCKQCRVQIVEGSEEVLEIDRTTFTPQELKAGWRLSCQSKVRSALKINLPAATMNANTFDAKVISNENVATFIKELCIQIPDDVDLSYIPGDYLQIHVPNYFTDSNDWKNSIDKAYHDDWNQFGMFGQKIKYSGGKEEVIRAYSMASHPAEGKIVKFNIRIATSPFHKGKLKKSVPWGICSSYLFSLVENDLVHVSGPYGESHMKEDEREVYFLIGGAGSSFARSHILDLILSKKTKRKVTLWYGARSMRENIYEEDFTNLAKDNDNFSYHIVLSDPLKQDFQNGWPKDDPIKTNFLYKAFERAELEGMENPEDNLYYICGPPMHNKSILLMLENYGVPAENIILDDFGS